MTTMAVADEAKAVVRRNTDEVQGKGRFDVFEELFADDFVDHTPQPGTTPDKAGVRKLYTYIRAAFPDFHAEIHFQLADLRIPPSNRLEQLKGSSESVYSIRINDQWRVVFRWLDGDAYDVAIVDYH